ncbi:LapA family protein [Corynebacterium anserum]|uniref:DUF1049 domain-containing protein n=1 Tax=Corynebacterium anserum TaxID=2684406 RepID=A0A7G7YNU7_9CORY|nr:LapA family protein [Corynebacterium anserum]MBC2681764.1 DUF1049 domain-containing protein [Corynebacterium anserum]QNH96167.1 DUF1049 domain-containing protein [Corynebacterium anserum]
MTNNNVPNDYSSTPGFDGSTTPQETASYTTDVPTRAPESQVIPPATEAQPAHTPSRTKADTKAEQKTVKGSIAGSTWVALIIGALLLILLLVFILQNQQSVRLQMFVWEVNFPIGVGMLIAAIIGALIMALVGGVRMVQLRRQVTARKN